MLKQTSPPGLNLCSEAVDLAQTMVNVLLACNGHFS
jgi:hypothetical protein